MVQCDQRSHCCLYLGMCLTILATVPMEMVQERLNSSFMIRFIVKYTPITSNILKDLWVNQVIG
jgi:uncharacterized membrane protein required for colicin V production